MSKKDKKICNSTCFGELSKQYVAKDYYNKNRYQWLFQLSMKEVENLFLKYFLL
jgi:hypothetical protein